MGSIESISNRYSHKLTTEMKSVIIRESICGRSTPEIARMLKDQFDIDISFQAVWEIRRKNIKRINKAMEKELDDAVALEPMATLTGRLARTRETYELARADYDEVVKMLADADTLSAQQRKFIASEVPRCLAVMNEAVKISAMDVANLRRLQLSMKGFMAKQGIDDRDVIEETITLVERKLTMTRKRAAENREETSDIMALVDWADDDGDGE